MLTKLHIKHFKAWSDTSSLRLAPLTIIFGGNSSGKSSLGHLLLGLKQTALISDRKRSLHLGDENSLIDLGTFSDCLYNHDPINPLEFSVRWKMDSPLTVKDTLNRNTSFSGDELELTVIIKADKQFQPETTSIEYKLINEDVVKLEILHKKEDKKVLLESNQYRFFKAPGRVWQLEPPEKFYRFSDRTLSRYQNADFLAEFSLMTEEMLKNFYYLGPLRSHPKRVYQWSGDAPQDVGPQGEYSIAALLAATEEGRKLNRGRKQKIQKFDSFIASWLKDLGIIDNFSVKPVAKGRKEYEVLIKVHPKSPEVKLTDVGFGISQVLPALVQAFYAPSNSVVWMEQPEIHLHPLVQSNLADAFISAIQSYENSSPRNIQLIIESHSEHFLNRVQRRVAEGVISEKDTAIYFAGKGENGAELQELTLDTFGEINNWPENFFGDEMAEISARTRAAMEKKRSLRQG